MSTKPLFAKGWEISGIKSPDQFFSALGEILPLPVAFCFEGTGISHEVKSLLNSNTIESGLQIPAGTIWPKPSTFHVIGTEQVLRQLEVVAGKHANSEICDHFHVYKDGFALMQWYDAFDLPLLASDSFSETSIQSFCDRLHAQFSPWNASEAARRAAELRRFR